MTFEYYIGLGATLPPEAMARAKREATAAFSRLVQRIGLPLARESVAAGLAAAPPDMALPPLAAVAMLLHETACSDEQAGAGRLVTFGDDGDGHWVTIGSHGEEGDRHGGTPVFIRDGRIIKGAPSLTGRRIDALKEAPDRPPEPGPNASKAELKAHKDKLAGIHRSEVRQSKEYQRAVWGKTIRKEGHNPQDLHQLAGEMLAHDREYVRDKTDALKSARRAMNEFGGHAKTMHFRADQGHDYASIPGFDEVAETFARQYPHLVGPNGDPQEVLSELLTSGNPQTMSEETAYSQAIDELRRYGPTMKEKNYRKGGKAKTAADEEPIPFSADFARSGQPRVPAGSAEGGEWTSGGGSDPFQSFQKSPTAPSSLFSPNADDKRPVAGREKTLRELSAVQKRNLSAWDMPQPVGLNHASMMHLPSGLKIESSIGDEYDVRDRDGKRLGHFATADAAAKFVETHGKVGGGSKLVETLRPAKAGSGKLFEFSDPLAGAGRYVGPSADFAQVHNRSTHR